jgi:pentatricopeptide repeat protein
MRIPSRWTRSLWQHQVQKALLLAPENGVAQRLRSFSTQKHIHHHGVPRGSVDRRVQSLLSHSPLGSLDDTTIDFLQRSLQRICKQEVLSVEDIQTAEKRLKRIEEEVAGGNAKLTTSPYNRLLRAYARSNGNEEYLLKTTNLLGHMFSCDYLPNPDTYTYDAALYVCTRSNCASAAATAEQILHEMQSLAETDGTVAPTLTSYHNVILSHANQSASVYGAAAAAEDWLMKLSDLGCQPGNEHLLPTTQAFNHVLQAWAICAENNGADRALQILELMKKLDDSPSTPDAISFGTVINAYARRNRPEGAEVVLKQALDYFTARQERDVESTDGDAAIVDLTNCLNRTMGAWSKSSHADAAAHAKNLLDDAYTLSSFTTSQSRLVFAPDAATHYYYIVTLLKDDVHGVVQADHHLYSMIQSCLKSSALANRVVPTTGTFHTVMKAWARSKRPERAERATKLLHA